MGDYTNFKKFYKPLNTEFVNVEAHWNYNLDIMDTEAFPVFNTVYTDETSITSSTLPKQRGYHWYKSWSNSSFFYTFDDHVAQDGSVLVQDWTIWGGMDFRWKNTVRDQRDMRVRYRIFPGGNVQWYGEVERFDGGQIPMKQPLLLGNAPVEARPTARRDCFIYGGVEFGNLKYGMFSIYPDGNIGISLMGNPSQPIGSRYVSLVGIQYAIS